MINVRHFLDYNAETGVFIWKIPARKPFLIGKPAGITNLGTGYFYIRIQQKNYPAHRLAWWYVNGEIPAGMEIDHINGIAGDNRIVNLQLCTRMENTARRHQAPSRSGFRGVSIHTQSGLYRARVRNKTKYCETAEEAALAFNKMAKQQYGRFARLNNVCGHKDPDNSSCCGYAESVTECMRNASVKS